MSWIKYIGGAVGWALGGPIGGILGFAFGSIVDDQSFKQKERINEGYRPSEDQRYQGYRHQTRPGDFASALLVLSAAVMKADGKHLKSELDYIRSFYQKQFGEAIAAEQIGVLKELLKKDIPVRQICEQIRYYMEHPMRLQLLHYLYGIAAADGDVDSQEVQLIDEMAKGMGVSDKDAESIKAMFYSDRTSAYTILEIDPACTDEEVKKAYRKMALKFHPDRVKDLGEDHQRAAQEKFIKVQNAYETIKKQRKMI
jgi:DnaJ like chaperone protein